MPLTALSKMVPAMLLALSALALPGCFHNDDDPAPVAPKPDPVVDADPTGYYSGPNGPTSVNDGVGGTIDLDDLQAMVNGNRIMMLSVENQLLYDGTITSISGNDFTADFIIYTDGENLMTASASGTITTASSINGTLSGTGVGSGTFDLLYAATNNQAAAVTSLWEGVGGGFDSFGFDIDSVGSLSHDLSAGFNRLFFQCKMNGAVTPVTGTRLSSVSVDLTDCFDTGVNGPYTGLTTTRDENAMDRLVYMVSNGTYTLSGEFN